MSATFPVLDRALVGVITTVPDETAGSSLPKAKSFITVTLVWSAMVAFAVPLDELASASFPKPGSTAIQMSAKNFQFKRNFPFYFFRTRAEGNGFPDLGPCTITGLILRLLSENKES